MFSFKDFKIDHLYQDKTLTVDHGYSLSGFIPDYLGALNSN